MSRRTLLRGLAATAGGAAVAGASARLAAAQAAPPDEWTVALSNPIEALDPNLFASAQTLSAQTVYYHIFDTLVGYVALRYGPGFSLVPRLAESWTAIDDLTWELKLRQGVTWHNGDAFTADDVVYSIEAAIDPESFRTTRNHIETAEIVDPSTIRIITKGLQAGIFQDLSTLAIVPKQVREQVGVDEFNANPVGTGPYRFVEWDRGQRVVVEANPNHWGGPVPNALSPRRLVFRSIPDATTRVAELTTGGVDIIAAPPAGQLEQLRSGDDTAIVSLKAARSIHYRFNTTKEPFADVRVRRAVNYAVNKDVIINDLLGGLAEPLHGPFSSAWLGYDPNLVPYPYDPDQARALLAEAGYPDGFETPLHYGTSGAVFRGQDIAEVIASQLGEVGITVQLVPTEDTIVSNNADLGTADGISQTTWGTSADPEIMLTVTLDSAIAKLLAPDQQLNDLITASRQTLDPAARVAVLQDIGRYAHDQAYWLFIHAQDDLYAKRAEVAWETPYPVAGSFSRVWFYQPN